MAGGYYSYDVPNSYMTVIALNGMYPFYKNTTDKAQGDSMLTWLENLLNTTTRQFIIAQHVYPGNDYQFYGGLEVFWDVDSQEKLHQIVADN